MNGINKIISKSIGNGINKIISKGIKKNILNRIYKSISFNSNLKKSKKILILILSIILGSESLQAGLEFTSKGGLTLCDPCCSDYWFDVSGRLEFDEILFPSSNEQRRKNFVSGGNIRRAYLALNGGVGDDLSYNLTLDFGRATGGVSQQATIDNRTIFGPSSAAGTQTVLINDAWLAYTGFCNTRIRIGQFTPLATMEDYTNYPTTNDQMFLESALEVMAFSTPSYTSTTSRIRKGLGLIFETALFDTFTFGATIYQPAHRNNNYGDPLRADRLGGSLKLTYSPIHDCDYAWHFGLLARYQSLFHTNAYNQINNILDRPILNTLFFTPPEVLPRNYIGVAPNNNIATMPIIFGAGPGLVDVYDPNLINTGALRAKSYNVISGEIGHIWGPLTLEGEYHYAKVNRVPYSLATFQKGNVKFYGWHIQGGYILTGESRCYDFRKGIITGIKPCHCYGALELVARYSVVDLFDKEVYGGAGHNATVGFNWYYNDNVRFAFNYIRSHINPTGLISGIAPQPKDVFKRKLNIVGSRIQVIF